MDKRSLWFGLVFLAIGLSGILCLTYFIISDTQSTPYFLRTGLITFSIIYIIGLIITTTFLIDNFADNWHNDLKQSRQQGDDNG